MWLVHVAPVLERAAVHEGTSRVGDSPVGDRAVRLHPVGVDRDGCTVCRSDTYPQRRTGVGGAHHIACGRCTRDIRARPTGAVTPPPLVRVADRRAPRPGARGAAVSVWPSCAVPEIVGGVWLTGGWLEPTTGAVASETAVEEPATFEPVTWTRSVDPTSALVATYVLPVAPGISVQPCPPSYSAATDR